MTGVGGINAMDKKNALRQVPHYRRGRLRGAEVEIKRVLKYIEKVDVWDVLNIVTTERPQLQRYDFGIAWYRGVAQFIKGYGRSGELFGVVGDGDLPVVAKMGRLKNRQRCTDDSGQVR